MAKQIEGVYEAILSCAKKEFLEKGYKDASLRVIAQEAGTSTGSIYTRFGDKEGLFEKRNEEFFVDLKEINKRQLLEAGVKDIDVCPYCTVCDNDLFFSYRRENGTTNRHSAILRLR